MIRLLLLVVLCGAVSLADGDFLTADEVSQVRLVQEPNQRIQLYLHFASQRADLVQQAIEREKIGRAPLIHKYLEQYTQIIEAIDTVSDDALKRKLPLDEGLKAAAAAEKELVTALQKIYDGKPKDLDRYEFALKQAIETTQDSADLAQQDVGQRSEEVRAKAEREKKAVEATMEPGELEQKKVAEQKENSTKRKPPTLLKKSETAGPASNR